MKKLFAIFFFIIFFAFNIIAQVKRESGSSKNIINSNTKKSRNKELMKELNLTKEQKGQVKELRMDMKQKKDEIDNDKSLSPVQRKEKITELRQEQKQKLNRILTAEQKDKLQEEKKNGKIKPDAFGF